MAATRPAFVSVIVFYLSAIWTHDGIVFFNTVVVCVGINTDVYKFSMVHVLGGSKNIFGRVKMDVFSMNT